MSMTQEIYLYFLLFFSLNSIWLTNRDTWMRLINATKNLCSAVRWLCKGPCQFWCPEFTLLVEKEKPTTEVVTLPQCCTMTFCKHTCIHTHVLTPIHTQINQWINKCSNNLKKNLCKSQQNGSAGKGSCWQVWGPHSILRFLSPKSSSDPHTCATAHLSIKINKYERKIWVCKLDLGL